jgi:MFS family permease
MARFSTPWYFGWNVLAVGLVFQAILFGSIFFSYTMWVNQWIADPTLHASLGQAMWGITVLTLTQGLVAPFAGRAMDAMSIRALVCTGATTAALGMALISQASAFWQIILIYGTLITAGTLLSGPLAAQTLAAKWFRGRRGLAIGLSTVGTSLGGFVMAPLIALLYLNFGWRTAHLVLAVAMIAIIVPLVWTVVRNTPEERGVAADPDRPGQPVGSAAISIRYTAAEILRQRTFWVMIVAFVPMVTAFGGIQQNLGPFARDAGIGDQQTAYLISIFSGVMIAGKIFFGAMADRFDQRLLYWLAVGTLTVAMWLMMTGPDFARLVLIATLLGFAAGGFLPLLGAIVGSRFGPASFGQVMGLIGPFMTISALGPLVAGRLRDATGSYDSVLLLFMALLVPAALGIFFLKPIAPAADPAALARRPA